MEIGPDNKQIYGTHFSGGEMGNGATFSGYVLFGEIMNYVFVVTQIKYGFR